MAPPLSSRPYSPEFGLSDILNERHVILDPSRVAAQVASGIGFIGAGTIILRREVVKGLTTAASIWAVAAVGLAVGGGMLSQQHSWPWPFSCWPSR